jgi:hypothetical protein
MAITAYEMQTPTEWEGVVVQLREPAVAHGQPATPSGTPRKSSPWPAWSNPCPSIAPPSLVSVNASAPAPKDLVANWPCSWVPLVFIDLVDEEKYETWPVQILARGFVYFYLRLFFCIFALYKLCFHI